MISVPRDIYPLLVEQARSPEVTILTGARQVGKTFLMRVGSSKA